MDMEGGSTQRHLVADAWHSGVRYRGRQTVQTLWPSWVCFRERHITQAPMIDRCKSLSTYVFDLSRQLKERQHMQRGNKPLWCSWVHCSVPSVRAWRRHQSSACPPSPSNRVCKSVINELNWIITALGAWAQSKTHTKLSIFAPF